MPFWEGIIDTVISNAPSIISTVGDVVGNNQITNGNNAAAEAVGQGYAEADDIYRGAYDESLGYQLDALGLDAETEAERLQQILPFIASLRDDYATGARASGLNYGDMLRGSATRYADEMMTGGRMFADMMGGAADEFDSRLSGAAGDFRTQIGEGAGQYDSAIKAGFGRADEMFSPYSEEGLHALDLLRTVTARGADEMDTSQRRMRDRSIEDMRAGLASSGLRGAGRAGVAVMNEGIADLDANIYDSNQARIDRAMETLSSLGYNATGQRSALATGAADRVGENQRRASDAIAGNDMSAAELAARTRMATDDLTARTNLDTWERGSGQILNASRDAATGEFNIEDAILRNDSARGDQALDLLNNFYTGRTNRGMSEADARTWSTMGKADSGATAAAGTGFATGQATAANARSNANTTGSIASSLGNLFRTNTRDTSAPTFSSAT